METLFVLIRKMPFGLQAAQGGHAIAQWVIENPGQTWNNNRLIMLEADCLDKQMRKLNRRQDDFTPFREPDQDNLITAIATQADGKLFKNLKLIGS